MCSLKANIYIYIWVILLYSHIYIYIYMFFSSSFPKNRTVTQELQFEEICERILHVTTDISDFFHGMAVLKEERPEMVSTTMFLNLCSLPSSFNFIFPQIFFKCKMMCIITVDQTSACNTNRIVFYCRHLFVNWH